MKRHKATEHLEQLLARVADQAEWPLTLIHRISVFGSYARSASEPGDVNVAVEYQRDDHEWLSHHINCLSRGQDLYTVFRVALRGRTRSVDIVFDTDSYKAIPMALIWRRGESLEVALERVRNLVDDTAVNQTGQDVMLPCLAVMTEWLPHFMRADLTELVRLKAISVDRVVLPDGPHAPNPEVLGLLGRRWVPDSPLHRSARAALAYLGDHDADLRSVNLHGLNFDEAVAQHSIGFSLKYIDDMLEFFVRNAGQTWIEIPCSTHREPIDALVIRPVDHAAITQFRQSSRSRFFR